MPMVPEVAIAMLACARIGAAHSVIFGGFSPESVRDRIHDANSALVITADGGYRRGSAVALQENNHEALHEWPGLNRRILLQRAGRTRRPPPRRRILGGGLRHGVHGRGPAQP